MAEPSGSRRTFGPVVALGLVSAALAAYAGTKPWVTGDLSDTVPSGAATSWGEAGSSPLATGLALVVLACWGVVLVTRGRFRRLVGWLAVLAALGVAATVAWAPANLPDDLRQQVQRRTGADLEETWLTGWFWLAVVASALVVAATVLGARLVRSWPEMGSRYDAPTGARGKDHPAGAAPTENIDMWKALDEGRDPTA
ncbi:Trp biosynthesis-associated membrane protein [Nocardioides sp. SYSU D00065]|uniref:Trp biosynthesis-associated membrane protein n=1 Tax=Nocardioides sp. SYSU D00065 TaxID=2817378 RepID=UPI001B324B83|nr:Trp biosynthesis-associated membrane protein [Nocardioides sp. SYSU D00065]